MKSNPKVKKIKTVIKKFNGKMAKICKKKMLIYKQNSK